MKLPFAFVRSVPQTLVLLTLAAAARADMDFQGEPVALSQVVSKAGAFRVTLPERSPLSTPAEIIKRTRAKEVAAVDYDWAKEVYDVYVPKTPGEGGKYGVMVGSVFKNYGAPPGNWGEMFDQYHLIWICSETVGDGESDIRRVGTMLDAAYNIGKIFPLQNGRVYASIGGGWKNLVGSVPLNYAGVFDAAMYTIGWEWFIKLPASKGAIWPPHMLPPDPAQMAIARQRGRYFFVGRKEEVHEPDDYSTEVVKRGYPAAGIKTVKQILVTTEQMGHYGAYDPTILDQAMTFLDADLAKLPPKPPEPSTASGAEPAKEKPVAAAPPSTDAKTTAAGTVDDATATKSAKDLAMAKNYIVLQKFDAARPKLEKIVASYPGTPAAKEAGKLLGEIEGK